jgi:hypothetical protein
MIKTTLFSLLITLAISLGFTQTTFGQSSGSAFVASNQQSQSLGEITINTPGEGYYLAAPGMTNDTVAIPDTAISVTINGQTVPQGTNAILQLLSGKFVMVMWPALNTIIVIDDGELG